MRQWGIVSLMVLSAVWGLLYADNEKDTQESTLSGLGMLRSAVAIYYSDAEGVFPQNLDVLVQDKRYLVNIPATALPEHKPSNKVTVKNGVSKAGKISDKGGWLYDPENGRVIVDCTHLDPKGSVWSTW